ncbi:MAG: ribonuclease III [Planctomycetota bacterium]
MTVPDEYLRQAEAIVGFEFRNKDILAQALTHASIADDRLESNERLEFLGDAALGMIVCEHLFHQFPDLLEGDLTKIKSTAVSRRMCATIASELGLHKLIALGKGMKTRQALPSSLAAAVLESIVGAIWLERGIDGAREFLIPLLERHIDQAHRSGHQQNFKSVLQQHAQNVLDLQPTYAILDEKGPDHAKCFEVAVEMGSERYPSRWASSKKQAEQAAALATLETLGVIERDADGNAVVVEPDPDETDADPDPSLNGSAKAPA